MLNFGKKDFIEKHENLPTQPNLILLKGHRPNFNGWPCLTKYWPILTKFCKLWVLTSHNLTIWLLLCILHQHQYLTTFFESNDQILDLSLEHYGHVLLYPHTRKLWLVTVSQSNHFIELIIHQYQYFIPLFQMVKF